MSLFERGAAWVLPFMDIKVRRSCASAGCSEQQSLLWALPSLWLVQVPDLVLVPDRSANPVDAAGFGLCGVDFTLSLCFKR